MKKPLLLVFCLLLVGQAISQNYGMFSYVTQGGQTIYYQVENGAAVIVPPNGYTRWRTWVGYTQPTGELVIPDVINNYPVRRIAMYAFADCNGLTSVSVPDNVTQIGQQSFCSCYNMESVHLGAGVMQIGTEAFAQCTSLVSITWPDSIRSIGMRSFSGCVALDTVYIPASATIGDDAFNSVPCISYGGASWFGCPWGALSMVKYHSSPFYYADAAHTVIVGFDTSATNVVIPNTVRMIADNAFRNIASITSVTVSGNLSSIGSRAFEYCTGLQSVVLPDSIGSLGACAFHACTSLGSVIIPFVQYIQEGYTFDSCISLQSAVFSDARTGLTAGMFRDCRHLVEVLLPNSNHIPAWCFWHCENLGNIVIPFSVSSIYRESFWGCYSLSRMLLTNPNPPQFYDCIEGETPISGSADLRVVIPCAALQSYQSSWGDFTFECLQLDSITVLSSNPTQGAAGILSAPGNSTVIIKAIPNYGHHFTSWNDGDTVNPRLITVTKDTTFIAMFARNTYYVSVQSADPVMGSASGGDSVEFLGTASVSAVPSYGYHFVSWNDGDTNNPRSVVVTQDSLIVALFGYNQYSLSLAVDTDVHGTVAGEGVYNYLSECTIAAVPAYGYHFTAWNDGDTGNPRVVTLVQDSTFTALFDRNSYYISAVSCNDTMGTAHGSSTVLFQDSVTIAATANYGYRFARWNDGSTVNPRTVHVVGDVTYIAYFDRETFVLSVQTDDSSRGHVSGGGSFEYLSQHTITATANYGYHFVQWSDGVTDSSRSVMLTCDTAFTAIFSPNQYTLSVVSGDESKGAVFGGGVYDFGDTVTVTATPSEHCHFLRWNDGSVENPREITIQGDGVMTAFFAVDTHVVTVEVDNISHGGVEGGGQFEYGHPCTVTATAYSGYVFVRWSNGATHNPYTFAVLADTTLVAVFAEESTEGIELDQPKGITIRIVGMRIIVEGGLDDKVSVYDDCGRLLATGMSALQAVVPTSGTYLVKVGDNPARKVVVVR